LKLEKLHLMQKQFETKNKLAGLDTLRAFAILSVFTYHYFVFFDHPEWLEKIGKFGWTGVDLFFVLSGYLISLQLFKQYNSFQKIDLKSFYIKRVCRILPAFLFIISLYFLFPIVREKEALAPLWKYLTFTQNLQLNVLHNGTFSHAWSLCVEEQFYLIFPLFFLLLISFNKVKKGFTILLSLFLLGLLIRHFWWQRVDMLFGKSNSFRVYWGMRIYFPTYCRLDGLLTGIAIAAVEVFKPTIKNTIEKDGNYFSIAGVIVLVLAYFICYNETSYTASILGFPIVSIGYGLIVFSATCKNSFLYNTKSTLLSKIATFSYSMYLSHKIVTHLVQKCFDYYEMDTDTFLVFICCLACTIVVSMLMYLIIEKTFLKWRNRILGYI
jgi:peptidoglycan/LPS O-acetylase OafA/YrhL